MKNEWRLWVVRALVLYALADTWWNAREAHRHAHDICEATPRCEVVDSTPATVTD